MNRLFYLLFISVFTIGYGQLVDIQSLGSEVQIFYDSLENKSIENVKDVSFEIVGQDIINFGLNKKSYWLKINGDDIPRHHNCLELSRTPTAKIYLYAYHLTDFTIEDVEVDIFKRSGEDSHFFTNSIFYNLPDFHHEYDFYIHFPPKKLTNHIAIHSGIKEAFFQRNVSKSLFLGIYVGFILVIVLFCLAIFIFFNEISYLLYTIYTISLGLLMLSFEGYSSYFIGIFGYKVTLENPFVLTSASTVFLIFFILLYFKVKTYSKWRFYIGVFLALIMVPFVFRYSSITAPEDFLYQTLLLLGGLYASYLILFSARVYKGTAYLFFIGYISLVIASTLYVLRNFEIAILPSFDNTIIIGHVLETVFFTIGIIIRILSLKNENEQSQFNLIEVQQKANEDLEAKVKNRTKELTKSNADLSQTLKLVRNQKSQLEERNKHIRSSIAYASQIQYSVFPAPSKLRAFFPDAFVLNKPKDKVSGDFYYFEQIITHDDVVTIVVAADCTGHGVPGAFMTLLGYNILKNIITINQETDPGLILSQLNVDFENYTSNSMLDLNDGMDVAVIAYSKNTEELLFSGAKSNLLLINDKGTQTIKGTRHRVGGVKKHEKIFETVQVELTKNETIYLSSDGYGDQLGGEFNKKLMYKNFVSLLTLNRKAPMHDQKEKLEKELFSWQGNNAQTDDILVIGIKF